MNKHSLLALSIVACVALGDEALRIIDGTRPGFSDEVTTVLVGCDYLQSDTIPFVASTARVSARFRATVVITQKISEAGEQIGADTAVVANVIRGFSTDRAKGMLTVDFYRCVEPGR